MQLEDEIPGATKPFGCPAFENLDLRPLDIDLHEVYLGFVGHEIIDRRAHDVTVDLAGIQRSKSERPLLSARASDETQWCCLGPRCSFGDLHTPPERRQVLLAELQVRTFRFQADDSRVRSSPEEPVRGATNVGTEVDDERTVAEGFRQPRVLALAEDLPEDLHVGTAEPQPERMRCPTHPKVTRLPIPGSHRGRNLAARHTYTIAVQAMPSLCRSRLSLWTFR